MCTLEVRVHDAHEPLRVEVRRVVPGVAYDDDGVLESVRKWVLRESVGGD